MRKITILSSKPFYELNTLNTLSLSPCTLSHREEAASERPPSVRIFYTGPVGLAKVKHLSFLRASATATYSDPEEGVSRVFRVSRPVFGRSRRPLQGPRPRCQRKGLTKLQSFAPLALSGHSSHRLSQHLTSIYRLFSRARVSRGTTLSQTKPSSGC